MKKKKEKKNEIIKLNPLWIRLFIFLFNFLKKKKKKKKKVKKLKNSDPSLSPPFPQLKSMAGLTGRFPFKPLLSHSSATPTTSAAAPSSSATATPIRTSLSPLPLSSSKSNAFRFRLHNSNSLHLVFTTSTRSTVVAQYGGGSRPSGPADSKRFDDGLGVDISAIRCVCLMLARFTCMMDEFCSLSLLFIYDFLDFLFVWLRLYGWFV